MTSFQFKAVTPDGKIRLGALPAENEKRAAAELRRQGLVPLYVGLEPQKEGFSFQLPKFGGNRRKAVLYFTQELATLLDAGIPVALSTDGVPHSMLFAMWEALARWDNDGQQRLGESRRAWRKRLHVRDLAAVAGYTAQQSGEVGDHGGIVAQGCGWRQRLASVGWAMSMSCRSP